MEMDIIYILRDSVTKCVSIVLLNTLMRNIIHTVIHLKVSTLIREFLTFLEIFFYIIRCHSKTTLNISILLFIFE
jgi:hypothetical protein